MDTTTPRTAGFEIEGGEVVRYSTERPTYVGRRRAAEATTPAPVERPRVAGFETDGGVAYYAY